MLQRQPVFTENTEGVFAASWQPHHTAKAFHIMLISSLDSWSAYIDGETVGTEYASREAAIEAVMAKIELDTREASNAKTLKRATAAVGAALILALTGHTLFSAWGPSTDERGARVVQSGSANHTLSNSAGASAKISKVAEKVAEYAEPTTTKRTSVVRLAALSPVPPPEKSDRADGKPEVGEPRAAKTADIAAHKSELSNLQSGLPAVSLDDVRTLTEPAIEPDAITTGAIDQNAEAQLNDTHAAPGDQSARLLEDKTSPETGPPDPLQEEATPELLDEPKPAHRSQDPKPRLHERDANEIAPAITPKTKHQTRSRKSRRAAKKRELNKKNSLRKKRISKAKKKRRAKKAKKRRPLIRKRVVRDAYGRKVVIYKVRRPRNFKEYRRIRRLQRRLAAKRMRQRYRDDW